MADDRYNGSGTLTAHGIPYMSISYSITGDQLTLTFNKTNTSKFGYQLQIFMFSNSDYSYNADEQLIWSFSGDDLNQKTCSRETTITIPASYFTSDRKNIYGKAWCQASDTGDCCDTADGYTYYLWCNSIKPAIEIEGFYPKFEWSVEAISGSRARIYASWGSTNPNVVKANLYIDTEYGSNIPYTFDYSGHVRDINAFAKNKKYYVRAFELYNSDGSINTVEYYNKAEGSEKDYYVDDVNEIRTIYDEEKPFRTYAVCFDKLGLDEKNPTNTIIISNVHDNFYKGRVTIQVLKSDGTIIKTYTTKSTNENVVLDKLPYNTAFTLKFKSHNFDSTMIDDDESNDNLFGIGCDTLETSSISTANILWNHNCIGYTNKIEVDVLQSNTYISVLNLYKDDILIDTKYPRNDQITDDDNYVYEIPTQTFSNCNHNSQYKICAILESYDNNGDWQDYKLEILANTPELTCSIEDVIVDYTKLSFKVTTNHPESLTSVAYGLIPYADVTMESEEYLNASHIDGDSLNRIDFPTCMATNTTDRIYTYIPDGYLQYVTRYYILAAISDGHNTVTAIVLIKTKGGIVKIKTDTGEVKNALAYVYDGSDWRMVIPYVSQSDGGTDWKLTGG